MVVQLNLFEVGACIEADKTDDNLTPRQWKLKRYLEANFRPGYWFTIEELCEADLGYTLNTNPKNHDKCIALSNDIRTINWSISEGYKLIIKNDKGSCKLAENKEEFDAWRDKELAKLEKKWKYLNNLRWKEKRADTVPVINLADRALAPEETKPVDVFMRAKEGE